MDRVVYYCRIGHTGTNYCAYFPGDVVIAATCGWYARVALGAHWPSDVIISYYLGVLWAAFLSRLALREPASSPN